MQPFLPQEDEEELVVSREEYQLCVNCVQRESLSFRVLGVKPGTQEPCVMFHPHSDAQTSGLTSFYPLIDIDRKYL